MGARYEIPDEPKPSRVAHFTCTPGATFLGYVMCGSLVGLPWMLFNGHAMGSATRREETITAVLTVLAELTLLAVIVVLFFVDVLPRGAAPYGGIAVQATRLVGGYRIHLLQQRSFELYQHFGGAVWRHGWTLVLGLVAIRLVLSGGLYELIWWL
jgi:hypothetical protein